MSTQDSTYLILGGTSKAGTTSLFLYLADHPAVCASNSKETGYFLDESYPRRARYRLSDGPDTYSEYFNQCLTRPIRLDATPDYLYSEGAAKRIKDTLPDARLMFILRDPLERLISWYRFSKQLGRLPADVTFEQYVDMQRAEQPVKPGEQQYMRALQQGCYSVYLRSYFEQFDRTRILVMPYGRLEREPRALLSDVCAFGGIDDTIYNDYSFEVHNKTQAMRFAGVNRAYLTARDGMRKQFNTNRFIKGALRPVRRGFESVFFQLNKGKDDGIDVPEALRRDLAAYYAAEPAAIGALMGRGPFAWD